MKNEKMDVVGRQQAEATGLRKELYPIGFRADEQSGEPRVKVGTHHLLEKMGKAGITTAYLVLRDGKWDIPAYFGDGRMVGVQLAYLVIKDSRGPPDTLDRAYPFVNTKPVAFGCSSGWPPARQTPCWDCTQRTVAE